MLLVLEVVKSIHYLCGYHKLTKPVFSVYPNTKMPFSGIEHRANISLVFGGGEIASLPFWASTSGGSFALACSGFLNTSMEGGLEEV